MFQNPGRGRQARNFTTNVPKILDIKSSFEQTFSKNWRWVPLIIGENTSSSRYPQSGVPQESKFGPLLFTSHISPLEDELQDYNLDCIFYADHSQVYVSINPNHPHDDALNTLRQSVSLKPWLQKSTETAKKLINHSTKQCGLHYQRLN